MFSDTFSEWIMKRHKVVLSSLLEMKFNSLYVRNKMLTVLYVRNKSDKCLYVINEVLNVCQLKLSFGNKSFNSV